MDPIGSGKCSQAGGENLPSGDTAGGWQRTSQTLNISARHDDELRDKATVKRLNDILKTEGKTGAVKAECEFAKQTRPPHIAGAGRSNVNSIRRFERARPYPPLYFRPWLVVVPKLLIPWPL